MSKNNKNNQIDINNVSIKNTSGNGIKVEMVSENQIPDDEKSALFEKEGNIDAIPDLDILTGQILEILEYFNTPHMIEIMKDEKKNEKVVMDLCTKYADTSMPFGIIKMLAEVKNRKKNVEMIVKLLESLQQAKDGHISLQDAELNIFEDANNKYVYPQYGSKQAFQQALLQDLSKERNKNIDTANIQELKNIGKAVFKN
jgi:hypothetical protein